MLSRAFSTRLLLTLFASSVLVVSAPGAHAYTPLQDTLGNVLEPDPYIMGNVTIANHHTACENDPLCFEDDSTNVRNLASYGMAINGNPTVTNPITYQPSHTECQYYAENATIPTTTSAWCGNISDKSWLDPLNWVKGGTGGSQSNTTFERVIRNGAQAIHIKNMGNVPGSVLSQTFSLSFANITTDLPKERLILGIEIVSKSGDGSIDIDDTGGVGARSFTFKNVSTGNPATDTSGVLMNSTGTTFWDPLITDGVSTSPGIVGGIQKLQINTYADSSIGPTEMYIYALGIQEKRFVFGQDYLGNDVNNMTYQGAATPPGNVQLATLAPSYAYLNLHDIKVAYVETADRLADPANVQIIGTSISGDPTYRWKEDYRFFFQLPSMIDLTYGGDEYMSHVLPVAGTQYEKLVVNGVDNTKAVKAIRGGQVYSSLAAGTVPKAITPFQWEAVIDFTSAQRDQITSVGFLGLPSTNPLSKLWVWLASLSVIGGAFAIGLRRGRKA